VENTYSTVSPLGGGANRSLSGVDCEDEFTRTVAKFDGTQSATRLRTQSSPPDDDGSGDDSCGEARRLAVLGAAEHTLDEIA